MRKFRGKKKVMFYVDAGRKAGLGHINECIGLRDYMARRYGIVSAIATSTPRRLRQIPHLQDTQIFSVHRGKTVGAVKYLIDIFQKDDFPIMIFNASKINKNIIKKLSDKITTFVITERDSECIGTVNFNVSKSPEYMVLDNAFTLKRSCFQVRPWFKQILIAFGGSDPDGMTVEAVWALKNLGMKERLNIITGRFFQQHKRLISACKGYKGRIDIFDDLSPIDIVQLILDSDMGITAGGDMMYEMAVVGIPFIVLPPLGKQRTNAINLLRALSSEELGKVIVDIRLKRGKDLFLNSIVWIRRYENRKRLSGILIFSYFHIFLSRQ